MIEWSEDSRKVELAVELEEQASRERVQMRKLANEVEITRIKVKTVEKRKMWERVLLGFCKLPALIILSIGVPVLLLCKREIPEQILNFMSL